MMDAQREFTPGLPAAVLTGAGLQSSLVVTYFGAEQPARESGGKSPHVDWDRPSQKIFLTAAGRDDERSQSPSGSQNFEWWRSPETKW